MFLKTLTIESSNGKIREITFHKGINLIVDESKANADNKQSGNNVGKTTILRLINFCLGGHAESIYQDPEFKYKSNETVKSFLTEQHVVITLVLKENLEIAKSREIILRRNFLPRKQKLQELNGQNYSSDKQYDLELKKAIFGTADEKPTFAQIRAKNIRDDAARLENTVKVLGNFGKDEEYEALYLFWLGVPYPDAEKKSRLLDAQRLEQQLLNRLRQENSESKIEQFLAIIQTEIEALEARKNSFNINANFAADLAELAKCNANLNQLSATQSQFELRKELIEESRRELENDQANTGTVAVAALYAQAKILIPKLQKTYEETVAFHNLMLAEKVRFITKELPLIDAKLNETKYKLQRALVAERQLKEKLQKIGIVEELQPIIAELNAKYEQKGKLSEQAAQMKASETALSRITKELKVLDQAMSDKDGLVQARVKAFNTHFSTISENLYGEKFALIAPQVENPKKRAKFYKLQIDSLSGRPGTGKKKGEIAAFDIAYIRFADEAKLSCLHFILHDQMEVVDDRQMVSLRDQAVQANCQFIVPILRDKLPTELTDPEYQVIALSEDDKLFKI
jgi:uncharacterized protein YydD (DUF2326 family)